MKRAVGASWVAAAAVFVVALTAASAAEEVGYWNIFRMKDQTSLFIGGATEDLEPTTSYGPIPFFCTQGSGSITVGGVLSDEMRHKMADAIKRDGLPPFVQFVPRPNRMGSYALALDYHVSHGWLFFFRISADEPYLQTFRQTGRFDFEVDGVRAEAASGPMRRIENVGKFIDECKRRNASRTGHGERDGTKT